MSIRADGLRIAAALTALGFCAGVAHAQGADQMQKLAKAGVQFSANNARVASEVCGVDASTVADYKRAASRKFAQDADFAKDWDAGWAHAAQTVDGLRQMKAGSPDEYAQQKSAICSDMRQQMKS